MTATPIADVTAELTPEQKHQEHQRQIERDRNQAKARDAAAVTAVVVRRWSLANALAVQLPIEGQAEGLRFERVYTTEGTNPVDMFEWQQRTAQIVDFKATGRMIEKINVNRAERGEPELTDMEKADLTAFAFRQEGVVFPERWSQNSTNVTSQKYFVGHVDTPDGDPSRNVPPREFTPAQLFTREIEKIALWGWEDGRFATEADRDAFMAELLYIQLAQLATFNSPVHFNMGVESRPQQASACFILTAEDHMDDILEWYKEEGIIFKGGSGAGINLSKIRSSKEKLSDGGYASGPVSFMRGADASAGTIKSGGKTRRAAKMVILNATHGDIVPFVECKVLEERKKRALKKAGFDMDLDGDDSHSIQYQNANNSVRAEDEFMVAVIRGQEHRTYAVTTGEVLEVMPARGLMSKIVGSTWECGDPGMQYHDTINGWHTSPAAGPINGSNPCSEYMHIDNSPCNLASVNMLGFLGEDGSFDIEKFVHVSEVVFVGQQILAVHCDYPTEKIGRNARGFRQLGLGTANNGALLMRLGLAYDSDDGRSLLAALHSLQNAVAWRMSARSAAVVGAYPGNPEDELPGFEHPDNRAATLGVLAKHAAYSRAILVPPTAEDRALETSIPRFQIKLNDGGEVEYSELPGDEFRIDIIHNEIYGGGEPAKRVPLIQLIGERANVIWVEAGELAERHGVENAQCSVLAPTGTIGLMMDCDTTGIEPDLALIKNKKLVGGGEMRIVNQSVEPTLRRLGYNDEETAQIIDFIAENNSVVGSLLKEEHRSIFACSMGKEGETIPYMGHVRVLAAVQPFISGSISKTINMPAEATLGDIEEVYVSGWRLGLKAMALYRDGSKGDQPLNVEGAVLAEDVVVALADSTSANAAFWRAYAEAFYVRLHPEHADEGMEKGKRRLPNSRPSITHAVTISDSYGVEHKMYFTISLFRDGSPAEIFAVAAKVGSPIRGMLDQLCMSMSDSLRRGQTMQEFVDYFLHSRFEPSGFTDNSDITKTGSPTDYLASLMASLWMEVDDLESRGINTRAVRSRKAAQLYGEVVPVQAEAAPTIGATSTPRKATGYEQTCPICGSPNMVPAGNCHYCNDCGSSTKCS